MISKYRPKLNWFIENMEGRLEENDHKGDWSDMYMMELLTFIYNKEVKLEDSVLEDLNPENVEVNGRKENLRQIVKRSADVANFAMMIADIAQTRLHGLESGE